MAQLDTFLSGSRLPTKAEQNELKKYTDQLTKSAGKLAQQQRDAAAAGRKAAAKIIARTSGKMPRVKYAMLASALAAAEAEVVKAEAEFEMLRIHLAVDALSVVDPTFISTGVSLWMIYQEGQM